MLYRNKVALAVLAAIIFFLLALQTPLLRAMRSQTWRIWTTTIGNIFKVGPLTVPNNVAEQLNRLTAENIRLRAALQEVKYLREQIGMVEFTDYHHIDAQIIGRPVDIFQNHFIVNKGTSHDLVLGAPVVIFGSQLVGFISELNKNTSTVQLLTHPATTLPGEVLAGEKTARGIVNGKSYTGVEISTVPRDIDLAFGQEVITVVQEKLVPAGLLIGTIDGGQTELHAPYQKASITIPFDQRDLRAVTILVAP